ncbi:DUF3592 domain-containing protein [Kribbella deserti]|uniref:DUF3592 domain-containing protein n=1 Tax=Kribbella deserti TaxID=1926257 RepID=A0ABV6QSW0_9ACTN
MTPDPERSLDGERRYRLRLRSVLCLLGALVVAGLGAEGAVKEHALAERGVLAPGVVLSVSEPAIRSPERITVRFSTRTGEVVEGTTGDYPSGLKAGNSIEVRYDPADPRNFQSSEWGSDFWLIVGGFGLTALALLAGAWVSARA